MQGSLKDMLVQAQVRHPAGQSITPEAQPNADEDMPDAPELISKGPTGRKRGKTSSNTPASSKPATPKKQTTASKPSTSKRPSRQKPPAVTPITKPAKRSRKTTAAAQQAADADDGESA